MGRCIIIGAGDFSKDFLCIHKDDFVIAADGGYEYLKELGIIPDVWIGDMDSTGQYTKMPDCENVKVIKLAREKDDTDTLAAIRLGLQEGYREFALHGMLGGRLDHTFANISCLQFLKKQGSSGILYGLDTIVLLLENQTIEFEDALWGMLSVFAWEKEACGVTERGLLYQIEDAVLTPEFPIGVSNELTGEKASISVKNGNLLLCIIPDRIKTQKNFCEEVFSIY